MNVQLQTIDEYIAGFPLEVQVVLEQMRATIRAAAPDATEAIKYGMPTFVQHGNLVHFAAFKNHIGFYPVPSGIAAFKAELSVYDQSKGTKFRLEENLRKATAKSKQKSKPTKIL
jgi:uncharacterized protein YdhG (YjbR/CyaY superfamily)